MIGGVEGGWNGAGGGDECGRGVCAETLGVEEGRAADEAEEVVGSRGGLSFREGEKGKEEGGERGSHFGDESVVGKLKLDDSMYR